MGISNLSGKPGEVLGGGGGKTLQCTSIPSREEGGSGDTSSHFMLQKPGKGSAGWATWLEYKLFF